MSSTVPMDQTFTRLTCTNEATFEKVKILRHVTVPTPLAPESAASRMYVDSGRSTPGAGLKKHGTVMSVDDVLPHVKLLGTLDELNVNRMTKTGDLRCIDSVTAGKVVCETSIASDSISAALLNVTKEATAPRLTLGRQAEPETQMRASRLSFSRHAGKVTPLRYGVRYGTTSASGASLQEACLDVKGVARFDSWVRAGHVTKASAQGVITTPMTVSLTTSDEPFTAKIKIVTVHPGHCEEAVVRVSQGLEGPPLVTYEPGETIVIRAEATGRSCVSIQLAHPSEVQTTGTAFYATAKVDIAEILTFSAEG